jgi:anti-sigma factor RsiW
VHLSDALLVALYDGELAPPARAAAQGHLRDCVDCARRLREVQAAAEDIARLLEQLDQPAPPVTADQVIARAARPPRLRRALLAAGIATLALTTAVAAGIVPRRWLVRAIAAVVGPRAAPTPAPAMSVPPGENGIAVVPGVSLRVSFDARQRAGEIRVALAADTEVAVRAVDDTVSYEVGPDAVVVRNAPGTVASYEVRVPRSIDRLWIEVDGHVVFDKNRAAITALVTPDPRTGAYVIPFARVSGAPAQPPRE